MKEPGSGQLRVLLVDDHPVVRAGLRTVLEQGDRLQVIGEADTGRDGARLAAQLRPDVVVLDISLPDIGGLEVARMIKQRDPSARILIVSMYNDDEHVLGMLEAGADGYLLKQCPPHELRTGVHQVYAGERVLHQSVMRALIAKAVNRSPAPSQQALSEREREVLQLLADGATSKEIAAALGLRPKTVENHRARIREKLGVVNSAAAVRTALAQGLISPTRSVASV